MNENYNEFSISQLRDMLLNGELKHELMTEEDYADILDNETSLEGFNLTVIDFCIDGLSKYEHYQELEKKINIDIDALIEKVDRENDMNRLFARS